MVGNAPVVTHAHARVRCKGHGSQAWPGVPDPLEQVIHVAIAFRDLGDLAGLRKFFAFWVVEGGLHEQDQSRVLRKFKELDMPIIMEWLRQEGIEIGLERGVKEGAYQKALEETPAVCKAMASPGPSSPSHRNPPRRPPGLILPTRGR